MTKKMRAYSTEFKAEAVKKITDNSGNITTTAKQLGIAMQTLSNLKLNKANLSVQHSMILSLWQLFRK